MRSAFLFFLVAASVSATIFSTVQGVVHDPNHRPVAGAAVTLHARDSAYGQTVSTSADGEFEFATVPAGQYTVTVKQTGFSEQEQRLAAVSGTAPVMHFQLQLAQQHESVEVVDSPEAVNPNSMTPTTVISRADIDITPGASLSNSLSMITNFVPGAYITHDQLHVRGGHQVTWAIDGVPIPNTNIASNVGPQIDPKDIDTLEVDRGGYSAEYGDRTYGVFNVIPRTGFERDREMQLNLTYGSFQQTNDQVSFGNHSTRLAYYGSMNGNRSDYGLSTPGPDINHDREVGLGGFGSVIFNADPSNQFRFVTTARRDDYQIPDTFDLERERDAVADFTWVHTLSPGWLFTASPFVHFNRANYDGDNTIQHLDSTYGGAQLALNAVSSRHNARVGVYGFAQSDNEFLGLTDDDGNSITASKGTNGHLEAAFLEDQFKILPWVTVTGGIRLTHFSGAIAENAANPRVGVAVRIPKLNWIFRGFFGSYYQAPPLSTVSGPLLEYAVQQGLGIIPLRGERDQENQVGLTVPVRGWTFDLNNFRQRAKNFFDHNPIGNSNVFFPVSIAGARIYGWEVTVRSPRILHRGQLSLAYSYQHAQAEGAISGGLTDFSAPDDGYFQLDHDQRHTLHVNGTVDLPGRTFAACSMYYGSGFSDGDTGLHLAPHTTFDVTLGKKFGESWALSVNALNAGNRRTLLDNSETFGGFHYEDPRQIYVQLRYRFRL